MGFLLDNDPERRLADLFDVLQRARGGMALLQSIDTHLREREGRLSFLRLFLH